MTQRADSDYAEARWYEAEQKRAQSLALALMEEVRRRDRHQVQIVAAIVEAAGGEVRVPRRLLVDPAELLEGQEHDIDGTLIYITRRAKP